MEGQSFLWEIVLTFFAILVIMAVATDTHDVGEAAAREDEELLALTGPLFDGVNELLRRSHLHEESIT